MRVPSPFLPTRRRSVVTTVLAASALVAAALWQGMPASAATVVAPTLTSMSPTSGPAGTTVTFTGTGFRSPMNVAFTSNVVVAATVASATKATVAVPTKAKTGTVKVVTVGKTLTAGTFTVTTATTGGGGGTTTPPTATPPALTIASGSPVAGPPTTKVTVSGTGFTASEAVDVYVGTVDQLLVTATSAGTIAATVTVPASAQPGNDRITAVGRKSGGSAQVAFTVRTDWTQVGFDSGASGRNPFENTISPANAGDLEPAWSVQDANGAGYLGTTVVAGGIAYLSGSDDVISTYDATTGAPGWTYAIPGGTSSSNDMVVSGGVLYVSVPGTESVIALNATTGAPIWSTVITDQAAHGLDQFPLIVVNGLVVVRNGLDVTALRTTDGGIAWSVTPSDSLEAGPVVVGGRVAVADAFGTVSVLSLTDGSTAAQRTLVEGSYALTAAGGALYVASSSAVYSLNPSGLGVHWEAAANTISSSAAAQAISVAGSSVYVVGGLAPHNFLQVLSTTDGFLRWSETLPFTELGSAPIIANGVLYVGSTTGALLGYNATTGASVSSSPGSDGSSAANENSAVVNGTAYVLTEGGSLTAFRLPASDVTANAKPAASALKVNTALKAQASLR